MTTNPILELTATSPPTSSSPKSKNKQGNDGGGIFDQFLTREIDRTRPQKKVARPAAKASEKYASPSNKNDSTTREASISSPASYQTDDTRQIKKDAAQPATPSAAESNHLDRTTLTAVAAANAEKPAVQAEAGKEAATGTTDAMVKVTLEMLTGGGQVGQAPPEQAQGLGVAVEQPPPLTNSSEPARLAEAQTETKSTSDQVDPQIISIEEFQKLLLLKQAGKDGLQNVGVQNTGEQNVGVQNTGVQNTGVQNVGVQNVGVQNTGAQDASAQNAGAQNAGVQNSGVKNAGVQITGAQKTDAQNSGVQKFVVDPQAELGAAASEKNQTAMQSATMNGSNSEQAAATTASSQIRAQAYLRSLQQYGQITEVTLSQTEDGKASSTTTTEQVSQSLTGQVSVGDVNKSIQNVGTPAKEATLQASKQTDQAAPAENVTPKQAEVQAKETGKIQETQIQSGTILESGQDFGTTSTKKSSTPMQSVTADGQTSQPATENQTGQVKTSQVKVEATAELGHAAKSSSSAALKSQAESKTSADADLSTADAAKAGDKTPPAAILNTHSSEVAQQSSNVRSAQRIVQQTFYHLDGMLQSGQKTLRVQLYPENLGHLELRLTSQAGSLQIVILADSSVTQQALQQNARDLQQALQESGVNLTGLTVGQRGDQEQTPGESHRTYQENKTSAQVTSESGTEDVDPAATSRLTYLNPYTSMEFRV